jgi:hypothetical protein
MNKYCCDRFKDSVKNGYIEKTDHYDETKWFLKEWLHIYYCPFCGRNVKGRGFGSYDVDIKKIQRKRASVIMRSSKKKSLGSSLKKATKKNL